ncbi:L-glyceraldehyde 3-phosphate reductase [soil metagenome]
MKEHEFKKRTPALAKPVQREPRLGGHATTPGEATVPGTAVHPLTGVPVVRPVQRDRLSWHQFTPEQDRYAKMPFRRCGRSGLKLPAISLGSWETFGGYVGPELARGCIFRAFNLGITHFDLANMYGSPAGKAETIVGRTLREMPRDEMCISTKAGFSMFPGPYGEGASRKSLIANLEQSLQRLGISYVDIFYSHRTDLSTPLEETFGAFEQMVRQGKTLYVGLSNYPAPIVAEAGRLAREMRLPLIAEQVGYSMLRREIERDVIGAARDAGMGIVAFSPLEQGLLTAKYLDHVPEGSRAAKTWSESQRASIPALRGKLRQLNDLAKSRGQTLPQMAIAWTLRQPEVATALIGASEIDQLEENAKAVEKLNFSEDELTRIDSILAG